MPFQDRTDAGRRLAQALAPLKDRDPVVVAIARGGVAVAQEVARALEAPLQAMAVGKLHAPDHPTRTVGAIGPRGERVLDHAALRELDVDDRLLEARATDVGREVAARERMVRGHGAGQEVRNRTVILIDDETDSGNTARLAARILRDQGPRRIIFATPVAPPATIEALRSEVDSTIFLVSPEELGSPHRWYLDFEQVTDEHAIKILDSLHKAPEERAARELAPPPVRVQPMQPAELAHREADA